MKRYRHTMVIGGTGMLRDASAELALRSDTMTSVARTTRSLDALNAVIHRETDHHRVALDWREPMLFLQAIAQHLEHSAPPDLVLAWVHNDELTLELARALAPNRCAFYHVTRKRESQSVGDSGELRARSPDIPNFIISAGRSGTYETERGKALADPRGNLGWHDCGNSTGNVEIHRRVSRLALS